MFAISAGEFDAGASMILSTAGELDFTTGHALLEAVAAALTVPGSSKPRQRHAWSGIHGVVFALPP